MTGGIGRVGAGEEGGFEGFEESAAAGLAEEPGCLAASIFPGACEAAALRKEEMFLAALVLVEVAPVGGRGVSSGILCMEGGG